MVISLPGSLASPYRSDNSSAASVGDVSHLRTLTSVCPYASCPNPLIVSSALRVEDAFRMCPAWQNSCVAMGE
jgi:hypothetical protein